MIRGTITNNPDYLHPGVSKVLQNVTRYVSKPLGLNKPLNEGKAKQEVDYASSLVLQVMLYYNVYFLPCWFLGITFLLPVIVSPINKLGEIDQVLIVLMLFAFIVMVIFEFARLLLGYIGNLRERVPELTAFWLLTLMVELPLGVFELIIYWFLPLKAPMIFALELVHFIIIVLQTIFGYIALRILARYQISRFHYKQFEMDTNDHQNPAFDWNTDDENPNSIKNFTTLKVKHT